MEIGLVRLPDDLPAIEALITQAERVDGHRPIGERKSFGLPHSAGLIAREGDELVGFVAFSPAEPGVWAIELAVAPAHRTHALYATLFDRAVAEGHRLQASALRAWIFQPGLAGAAVEAGFSEERRLFMLERSLPLGRTSEYPPGIRVASFRPELDAPSWLELNNRAFAGHPENGGWSESDLNLRLQADWFDPALFLLAWAGEKLAGFNWLKLTDRVGEVYVIAVSEPGSGLGTALLTDGMERLSGRGAGKVVLYVEGDNSPALDVYRRLGFYLDHVDRAFIRR